MKYEEERRELNELRGFRKDLDGIEETTDIDGRNILFAKRSVDCRINEVLGEMSKEWDV